MFKQRDAEWKIIRADVWTAVQNDDKELLARALASAAARFDTTEGDVLFQLQKRLWRTNKGKRRVNRVTGETEYNERGLLEECAGNHNAGMVNAPDYGATACIQWLCDYHPDAWTPNEIKWAIRRAKRLGRETIVDQLLQIFPEYKHIQDPNGHDIRTIQPKDKNRQSS